MIQKFNKTDLIYHSFRKKIKIKMITIKIMKNSFRFNQLKRIYRKIIIKTMRMKENYRNLKRILKKIKNNKSYIVKNQKANKKKVNNKPQANNRPKVNKKTKRRKRRQKIKKMVISLIKKFWHKLKNF